MEGKAKTPAGKVEWLRPRRRVSKVLNGNQQRCAKQSKTFISVRI
ncbi:hypothetical protein ABE036_09520 [Priestia aryabhattai]